MLAIFAGRGADAAFRQTILNTLKTKAKLSEISDDQIYCEGGDSELTAVFEKNPAKIYAPDAAVVLCRASNLEDFRGQRYCILNSANSDDIETAKRSGGEVISCGLSLRDTVTFSSFTDDRCVISIQRPITRFDGRTVEPFELPLSVNEGDDRYAILSANLLLILGGYI